MIYMESKMIYETHNVCKMYKELILANTNGNILFDFFNIYSIRNNKVNISEIPQFFDYIASNEKFNAAFQLLSSGSLDGKEYRTLSLRYRQLLWACGVLQRIVLSSILGVCVDRNRKTRITSIHELRDYMFATEDMSSGYDQYKKVLKKVLKIMEKALCTNDIILYIYVDKDGICRINNNLKGI
jgi:hypothetical protein